VRARSSGLQGIGQVPAPAREAAAPAPAAARTPRLREAAEVAGSAGRPGARARGAQACEREVVEERLKADGVADRAADRRRGVARQDGARAAALARGEVVLAPGRRVAARAVPEMHVADEAERLERLEVAVDRREVGGRHGA